MNFEALESSLEGRVVRYAESHGMLHVKFTPAGSAGWPDRMFITPTGIHFYIEFKRRGKSLEKLQEHRRWQLQTHKCNVYGPVDDIDHAKEIIDYYVHLSKAGVDST